MESNHWINKPYSEMSEKEKEDSRARWRAYYQRNKQKLNERNNEEVKCDCGCMVQKRYLNRHKKSKKHNDIVMGQKHHFMYCNTSYQ